MIIEGQIRKMITEIAHPIQYYMDLNGDFLDVNQQLGKKIQLTHDHNVCVGCGFDKSLFRMGFCKNCFFTLPQANENILRPELSTAHLGIEKRDLAWEKTFELQPHIVYLAASAEVKVGVTRASQLPTRWIDQGASAAIILAKTNNRYEAGMIEVALKEHLTDKTSYQRMLKNEILSVDLVQMKEKMKLFVPEAFAQFISEDDSVTVLDYPVMQFPKKIQSLKLDNHNVYEGTLVGIKAQYWIFEDQTVWNVRAHEGRYVKIEL
ncbi:MAG TPA: DUF2797 domain-containing protein [Moheibacter sp.]|nr:DUF2797 domain-containing protein [Moheibacter sp.]